MSVTLVRPSHPVEIFGNFLRRLVPWPSIDIHGKFYGDHPRGTPPTGGLNERGVAKYSDFSPLECCIIETVQKGGKLVLGLITNRKSYISFRLVQKSVILNDLGRRNGPYLALFLPNLVISGAYCVKVVDKAITMDNLRLLCLVVNVCRGTARRPPYKFLTDSKIQDLMRSTCLAIVLIRSRI